MFFDVWFSEHQQLPRRPIIIVNICEVPSIVFLHDFLADVLPHPFERLLARDADPGEGLFCDYFSGDGVPVPAENGRGAEHVADVEPSGMVVAAEGEQLEEQLSG